MSSPSLQAKPCKYQGMLSSTEDEPELIIENHIHQKSAFINTNQLDKVSFFDQKTTSVCDDDFNKKKKKTSSLLKDFKERFGNGMIGSTKRAEDSK